MKKYVRKVFYTMLSALNKIVKKEKRIVVYAGRVLNDNNEAIFRYLVDHTDYEIVCIANKYMDYSLRPNVKFVKDTIWNAMYYLWTSKVVFDASLHRVKMKPTQNQIFFQMWHGSPLKFLKPSNDLIKDKEYYSYICYASEFFKESMKYPFSADDTQMLLNGNPRCDYLFKTTCVQQVRNNAKKSVVWLPTYRSGLGLNYKGNEIPVINAENITTLNTFLSAKDVMLYIKPHPLQSISIKELLLDGNLSNIKVISNEDLEKENIPLYDFLGAMDALLTDYSSVYFDYLLIDKPIGFVIDDIHTYKESVGYIVENPMDYMPGDKIYNIEELCLFFDNLVNGIDLYKKERENTNNLVNFYQDDKNSFRAVEVIKDIMK